MATQQFVELELEEHFFSSNNIYLWSCEKKNLPKLINLNVILPQRFHFVDIW